MKNHKVESEITDILNEAQSRLLDGDLRKTDIGTIVYSIGLSRHAYYGVIDSEVMPSKSTIIKVAYAFQLTGDQLIKLMNLNGYIFPFSYSDSIVLSFFQKNEADEYEIDEALLSSKEKPIFSSTRTRKVLN